MNADALYGQDFGGRRSGPAGATDAGCEPAAATTPQPATHSRIPRAAGAGDSVPPWESLCDRSAFDFDVRDYGHYLVVVGTLPAAQCELLRLTHVEAGADPHGDGTVWWPKEAPDA